MVMKKISCNLCPQFFTENPDLPTQLKRHEEWHLYARIQKRNTANGRVSWIVGKM